MPCILYVECFTSAPVTTTAGQGPWGQPPLSGFPPGASPFLYPGKLSSQAEMPLYEGGVYRAPQGVGGTAVISPSTGLSSRMGEGLVRAKDKALLVTIEWA